MKRINAIFFAAMAAALSLVSCSQENLAPTEKPQGELVTVHFGAESGIASSTKATLTTEDETTFRSAWADGDVLSVEYNNDNDDNNAGIVDATWQGSSESFDAKLPSYTGKWSYDVIYPAPASDEVDFGSSRTQKGNEYNGIYDLMRGSAIVENAAAGKDDEDNNIVFKMARQTAIAYFHLKSEFDEEVVSATLSVEGGNISVANMLCDHKSGFVPVDESNNITITYEAGTAPSAKDFQLWFNVLPTEYTSMKLEVETKGHKLTLSNSNSGKYEAANLYKVVKTIPTDKWVEKKISGLTFDFSSKITGWPAEKSKAKDGGYSYALEGKTYSFVHEGGVYCGGTSSPYYLMISKGGRLGLPAIAGYKLSKVVCTNTSGASQKTNVSIEDIDGVTVSGGEVITWDKLSSTYTYNLSGTHENIVYYMDVTNVANCQLLTLVLDYEPAAPAYYITLSDVEGGDVTVGSRLAEAGSVVSLIATPATGYEFKAWDVKDSDGVSVEVADGKFTMPAKDVTVSAVFTKAEYKIEKADAEHGSFIVKVNGKEATVANYGDEVTLEAKSDEGYSFDNWTVKDEDKNTVSVSNNKFIMPAAGVSISANFIQSTFASLEELVEAGRPTTAGRTVTVTLNKEIISKLKNTNSGVYIDVKKTDGNKQTIGIHCSGRPSDWTVDGFVSGTLKDCKWSYVSSSEWRLNPDNYDELTYTPAPVINCEDVTVAAGATECTLTYSIDNPLDGAAASVDVDGSVVTSAVVNASAIDCVISPNTTTSTKKGSVTIKYAHVSKTVSITQEANTLSVDQNTKTWASDATDEFVIKVEVNNGASWTVSSETLDWATVSVDNAAGTIKVKPNGKNDYGAAYEGKLTVTHDQATSLTETITLKQLQIGAVATKEYTATIDVNALSETSSTSTGYAKYNGDHTIVATSKDGSSITMTFSSTNVMTNTANGLQFKAEAGTISGSNWGVIKSVDAGNADLTVSISDDKSSFVVSKTTKKAGYTKAIVVVFEK